MTNPTANADGVLRLVTLAAPNGHIENGINEVEMEEGGDWEEEEEYLLFDFGKNLTLAELEAAGFQCKIIGLDGPTHFVQVGPNVYRGEVTESLGNDLLFKKTPPALPPSRPPPPGQDAAELPYDQNHPGQYATLELEHVLDRRVRMHPVRLERKPPATPVDSASGPKPPAPLSPQQATAAAQPALLSPAEIMAAAAAAALSSADPGSS
ncbi:hypothetical protein AMAG_03672 [Allomyces macrogynus ATCC 38327]|uniref:Transcription factor TFIIIC triple barrel domain-containing protein n=1 Tax=Allomyces macrogynus (strain ATCC 38327) TaxID=578462 RepID=A0A0L0S9W3_ALLM3|nr:hypothetical protein AMAG_03672 [Allomyces macrogynus ATCC 38327]|eukprot:KNE59388.1 hypothetical protein AMAG_03672 [Allomyces macrogynus ATCC 38327]